MFSFNYKKCVDIWNIEWDEICNRLEKNEENLPKFEDLIKDAVFSHVIAQIMEYSKLFTVYPQDISKLFRGVCENDPSKICVERFIPQKEYINPEKPCRMNGTDRLYNYFTIDYLDCTGKDLILTSAHELRLQPSDSFWGAFFTIPAELGEMRIIDLRTRAKIPTDDKQFQRFLKLKATHGIRFGKVDQQEVEYWIIQAVFSIWEKSRMFAPVDKTNPETLWHQYRPFHVLCDFFQRNGFGGIIYRSTVYRKGICLCLFDVSTAICDEQTITQYDSAKYC